MIIILIIVSCVALFGVGYSIYLNNKCTQLIQNKYNHINTEIDKIQSNKDKLSSEYKDKQKELEQLTENIKIQSNTLQQVQNNIDILKDDAKTRAYQVYKAKELELQNEYLRKQQELELELSSSLDQMKQQKEDLQADIDVINKLRQEATAELDSLKAKQRAYIAAKKREEEIREKQDYYRLVISQEDKDDIALLRDLQKRMINKNSIDKVIYETYYRSAYNTLISHLSLSNKKLSGIYKITDTVTKLIYIGQSTDIKERLKTHIKTALTYGKATNKLYQAMQEHLPENFTFEILEEVPRDKLNEREVYWIDFYGSKECGLNKTIGGS